jgi:hypothetical protein
MTGPSNTIQLAKTRSTNLSSAGSTKAKTTKAATPAKTTKSAIQAAKGKATKLAPKSNGKANDASKNGPHTISHKEWVKIQAQLALLKKYKKIIDREEKH